MDKNEVRKFKHILQTRAQELRRSISETQQEGRIAQEVHGRDEGDRASRSHEKELLFHRNTQVRALLKAIESALGRIEEGSFGECVNWDRRLKRSGWKRCLGLYTASPAKDCLSSVSNSVVPI